MVGVAAVLLLVFVELGGRAVDRAEAQTAADVAALAAAHEGRPGAADLAARNGAELLSFADVDGAVMVEVRVGRMRASAWAELDWQSIPATGSEP
jgi:uncharacterized membrane protein